MASEWSTGEWFPRKKKSETSSLSLSLESVYLLPTLFGRCRSKYAEMDCRSGSEYLAATSNTCNSWCRHDGFFWNTWKRRRTSSTLIENRIKCSKSERILPRMVSSVRSRWSVSISAREIPLEQAIVLFCNEAKTIWSMAERRRCWSAGLAREGIQRINKTVNEGLISDGDGVLSIEEDWSMISWRHRSINWVDGEGRYCRKAKHFS